MTSCVPLTDEAALLTRLMLAYNNNIEQLLASSELTGPEQLDFAGNCLTRTRAALATLDSLEADFPESVSVVGSREGSTVPGFTLSSRTCLRRRRGGRRKVREAVITHTEATDTATTKTETAAAGDKKTGAVTMIIIYHSKSQSSGKANSDS